MRTQTRASSNTRRRGGVKRAVAVWTAAGVLAWVAGKSIAPYVFPPQEGARKSAVAQLEIKPRPAVPTRVTEPIVEKPSPVLRLREFPVNRKPFSRAREQQWTQYWEKMARDVKQSGRKEAILSDATLEKLARATQNQYGIPRAIVRAFIDQESGGNVNATGSFLEMGLTQFRPGKIVELQEMGCSVNNPFDPVQNMRLFAFAFSGYVQSAQSRATSDGSLRERRYAWNKKSVGFSELPFEIQLELVARIHNAGVENTFSGKETSGIYDPIKILSGERGEYARGILTRFTRYAREE